MFPEDVARTCFQCFFGSPPAIDPTTTWTLELNPITPSQGETVGGVLAIFDPVGTIGTDPVRLVCTTSSNDVLSVFAQALGKLLHRKYLQYANFIMFRCNSFAHALSLQRHHSTCRMIAFSHCQCTIPKLTSLLPALQYLCPQGSRI